MLKHAKKVAEAKELILVDARTRSQDRPTRARIYMWPKNESVLENFLVGRRVRPVAAMKALMPKVLEAVGQVPEVSVRWSQKAGCGCGCSPGFIADRSFFVDGRTVDVHVTFDVNG